MGRLTKDKNEGKNAAHLVVPVEKPSVDTPVAPSGYLPPQCNARPVKAPSMLHLREVSLLIANHRSLAIDVLEGRRILLANTPTLAADEEHGRGLLHRLPDGRRRAVVRRLDGRERLREVSRERREARAFDVSLVLPTDRRHVVVELRVVAVDPFAERVLEGDVVDAVRARLAELRLAEELLVLRLAQLDVETISLRECI